jgi:hypothetical protein
VSSGVQLGTDLKEELEDVPVGDAPGVEDELDPLGVTRMVRGLSFCPPV